MFVAFNSTIGDSSSKIIQIIIIGISARCQHSFAQAPGVGGKIKVFPAFIIEGEEEQACPNSGIR